MWFTVVYKNNGETNEAPKEACVYTRSEEAAQIDKTTCTISTDDVPEPDGATPLNNGTDSREDGRTSLQRQKTGAHDGENESLDMKKTKLNERESERCVEMRAKTIDRRMCLVTELQLANISEDVGNFWRELGPILRISAAKIQNLDEEYRCNRDKANSLLISWKQKEGKSATAGILSDALESIGRKDIADSVLEMCDENLPPVINVGEGDEISLRVLDSKRGNKLILCKDPQGNKYEDVPVSVQGLGVAMETEQTSFLRQNSLIRARSGVQELRRQLKKVKSKSTHSSVDETSKVELLLQWCEEQRSCCEGIYLSLIRTIGAVFGEIMKDNSKCIHQFLEFTLEVKDQENKIFSRIEPALSQSHHLDKHQVSRVEQLEKWRRAHKKHIEEVEKLLSFLLDQQAKTDQKSRHQSLSEWSGVDEIRNISKPLIVHQISLMEIQKTFSKERKVNHESQL
ncbi:uncharacterized protein [Pocillopora verrucosa]|uniref:uncharacterized protein isoform X2 n=1 Tax=Pocillopora verrucosa TaxID=203993 RepID=UPI00333E9540